MIHGRSEMGTKTKTRYVSWRGNTWKDSIPGVGPAQAEYLASLRQYGFSRTGADVPKRRELIRLNQNASGLMNISVSSATADDLRATVFMEISNSVVQRHHWTYGMSGVFQDLNEPTPISAHQGLFSMSEACAIAIRILNKRITDRRRQLMGGVVLGELGKTLGLVLKPAKTLRSHVGTYINRLRKLRKRETSDHLWRKTVADTWLEAVFGWKPLVKDVQDGAKALARYVTRHALERQQFRAYGERDSSISSTKESATRSCGTGVSVKYNIFRHTHNKSICIIYGKFQTKLRDSLGAVASAGELDRLCGLFFDIEDIAPQIWELIPWSFLVDYFVNVGDVLESFANVRSDLGWLEEVHIMETLVSRSYVFDPTWVSANAGYLGHEALDGTSESSFKTIDRHVFLGEYQSQLDVRLPVGLQWLNIAALVAGGRSFQPFTNR
jgi:hypothetical protein